MTRAFSADEEILNLQAYRLASRRWRPDRVEPITVAGESATDVAETLGAGTFDNPTRGNRSSATVWSESSDIARPRPICRAVQIEADLDQLISELETEVDRLTAGME